MTKKSRDSRKNRPSFLHRFRWVFRITATLDPDGRPIPRSTSVHVSDNQRRKPISSCFEICDNTHPSGASPHWSSLSDGLFELHGIVSLCHSHLLVIVVVFIFIRRCRLLFLLIRVISRGDCYKTMNQDREIPTDPG
jgi:hypothetical protein